MRSSFMRCLLVAGTVLAMSIGVTPILAQQPERPVVAGPQTRADLEAEASRLEQEAAQANASSDTRAAEAARIRARLRDGDFNAGDRVVVKVDSGVMARADTFIVREGRLVEFQGLPPIALTGVLHAELSEYLAHQLSRFFRDPKVEAYPLLRVAIFGPVGRPGYYSLPADLLLSDAIMSAGGPGSMAKMDQSVVRRGTIEVIDKREVHRALVYGYTLSQMNIRDGDAIHIGGSTSQRNWVNVLRTVSIGFGLVFTLHRVSRSF
ncbi:MAG TPA: SLBB domain-containing protein [Gemmatimonadaceae bacterium]|nr:SLBB domain-containing protein [Gemmatimonadaceae bacterium]